MWFVLHEEWHNNVKVVRLVSFWPNHFLHTKRACAHCPREVVQIRTSKPSCLGKWLSVIVQISMKKRSHCIRISVYSMAIPYCDEACAVCGTCVQLSPQAKSEITSLVSQALSSFRSFALHNASNSESLETRILNQYSLWIRILLAYDHSQEATSEQIFWLWGHACHM